MLKTNLIDLFGEVGLTSLLTYVNTFNESIKRFHKLHFTQVDLANVIKAILSL